MQSEQEEQIISSREREQVVMDDLRGKDDEGERWEAGRRVGERTRMKKTFFNILHTHL